MGVDSYQPCLWQKNVVAYDRMSSSLYRVLLHYGTFSQTCQIVFLVVRKTAASAGAPKKAGGAGAAGMWRFYTEDSPGIKV